MVLKHDTIRKCRLMIGTLDYALKFYNTTKALMYHTWKEKDHTKRPQKIVDKFQKSWAQVDNKNLTNSFLGGQYLRMPEAVEARISSCTQPERLHWPY